mmetsp:Transcript_96614/g.208458  ORF Transcript_96614/g.208458 Transcript_96614/m.208458 type:complete len:83 (-) Transcript_96614:98-346(-)
MTSEPEILARTYKIIKEFPMLEIKGIDLNAHYTKLGLDSLDWNAFVLGLETEFRTIFEDHIFDRFETIQDVITYLKGDPGAF